jgi:hypothetical protein
VQSVTRFMLSGDHLRGRSWVGIRPAHPRCRCGGVMMSVQEVSGRQPRGILLDDRGLIWIRHLHSHDQMVIALRTSFLRL